MKQILKKVHLWLSLPAGIIIVILCITGALLVFQRDINKIVDKDIQTVENYQGRQVLPMDSLCNTAFSKSKHGAFASLTIYADSTKAWNFKPAGHYEKDLWINQYTAEITGRGSSTSSFFTPVRQFHRWLLFSGEGFWSRQTGRTIIGISTLCLLFILLSGFGIAIPKKAVQWKQYLSIKKGNTPWMLWFTSHRALGWYCAIFLLAMALTGPMWSFSWYRSLASKMFNADGERPRKENKGKKAEIEKPNTLAWNKALASIKKEVPDYVSVTLQNNSGSVKRPSHHKLANDRFTFDENGIITSYTQYKDIPNNQKIMGYAYIIHTGDWGGMFSKILYFLASLGGAFLTISGYWLYWKRIRKPSKQNI